MPSLRLGPPTALTPPPFSPWQATHCSAKIALPRAAASESFDRFENESTYSATSLICSGVSKESAPNLGISDWRESELAFRTPLLIVCSMLARSPPHSQSSSARLGKPLAPWPPEPWQGAQLAANTLRPPAMA